MKFIINSDLKKEPARKKINAKLKYLERILTDDEKRCAEHLLEKIRIQNEKENS